MNNIFVIIKLLLSTIVIIINGQNINKNLDQQIIKSIPRKLNLASFGIYKNNDNRNDELKNLLFNYNENYNNNNNNNNNEMEWEYYNNGNNNNRRRQKSTTTTTTTTTPIPYIKYKSNNRKIKINYRPIISEYSTTSSPTLKTTSSSSINLNYHQIMPPIRDCKKECISRHLLQHYYNKNCRSIFSRDCNCEKRFICNDNVFNVIDNENINNNNYNNDENYCTIDGKKYEIDDTIPIPNQPCSVCRCRRDYYSNNRIKAKIDCSKIIDCPELAFGVRPSNNDCYFSYSHKQCCGIEICTNELKFNDKRLNIKCNYNNKQYKYGERINLKENLCKQCICNEYWNEYDPESSKDSCIEQNCLINYNSNNNNNNNNNNNENCLPIYQNDRCCPIDFICFYKNNYNNQNNNNFTLINTDDNEYLYRKYYNNFDYLNDRNKSIGKLKYHCSFNNKQYRLGDTIFIEKNLTLLNNTCSLCQCKIPPFMTCTSSDCNF